MKMMWWVHSIVYFFSALAVAGISTGPRVGSPLNRADHSRWMNVEVICWLLVGLVTRLFIELRFGLALDGLAVTSFINGGLVCWQPEGFY
jgi:hypothetical protein